jgi:membrane protein required for colicin V production
MNLTDILIIIGLILYMILGYRDGLMKKIFGIIGFWVGLIVATKYMETIGVRFMTWFDLEESIAFVLSFFCIFTMVALFGNLSYRWYGKTSTESLNSFSRIGGAILGAAQGLVGLSLILLMLNIFEVPSEESQNTSMLYNDTIQIAPSVFDFSTSWLPDSKVFYDEMKGLVKHINFAR